MGRHAIEAPTAPTAPLGRPAGDAGRARSAGATAARRRRTARHRPLRRRASITVGAMAACIGFALVNVGDPSAGAAASTFYEAPVQATHPAAVQRFAIAGGTVVVDVRRDTYQVEQGVPGVVPVGTAQAYAASLVAERGWGADQWGCLVKLWNQESGWNSRAENVSSGAYGIPQALPGDKMGPGWHDDYRVQIAWGMRYIAARYGSPCGAWASEVSQGSY